MDVLEVKHWLNRAFYADKKVKALEMRVKQCRERAQSVSICYEGNNSGASGNAKNGTENAYMRLVDMEHTLRQEMDKLLNVSDEIDEAIKRLDNTDLETVLIHRYLLFHTIEQTAEYMHYSVRAVKNKQKEAVEKIAPFCLVLPLQK